LVVKDSNIELEIERTFLAREIPAEITDVKPDRIHDVHILGSAGRPFLRLRDRAGRYQITKKLYLDPKDVSVQTEQTIPLDAAEFAALSRASRLQVVKDRYRVPMEGHMAEVDIFTGELEGLVLIDFEFDSKSARDSFVPPACCLADVTQELFVDNGMLASSSYKDIERELERFQYRRLLR
jgi:adenylate cyclase